LKELDHIRKRQERRRQIEFFCWYLAALVVLLLGIALIFFAPLMDQ
jgi:hypothetical protein